MKVFALIMAGGVGSRFWPRSREKSPKQLLNIFGEDTMIQSTVNRLKGIVEHENIFVVTNKIQADGVKKQLPDIPHKNILSEPFGKNTAACIGLGAIHIKKQEEDSICIVLPADHLIHDVESYHQNLRTAIRYAYEEKALVTIGITPTRPETGYGYIQIGSEQKDKGVYKVKSFAEKPNYATAVRFLESGDFFWNSGMFIWRTDVILQEIRNLMPDLYDELEKIQPFIGKDEYENVLYSAYSAMRNISIDYGVMEKSDNVYLVRSEFRWSDVGSWEEVYHLSEKDEQGNAKVGKVYTDLTMDSYIYSPEKFTALIGVENVIVINTNDATLICRRDQAQDVKKVVDFLKHSHQNDII